MFKFSLKEKVLHVFVNNKYNIEFMVSIMKNL